MKPILSTTQVDDLAPSFGAEFLIPHLRVVCGVKVLILPGRLVLLVQPRPDPEVWHPLIDELLVETALDFEPAVGQEMLRLFIGQMGVRFGRRDGLVQPSESVAGSLLDEVRLARDLD